MYLRIQAAEEEAKRKAAAEAARAEVGLAPSASDAELARRQADLEKGRKLKDDAAREVETALEAQKSAVEMSQYTYTATWAATLGKCKHEYCRKAKSDHFGDTLRCYDPQRAATATAAYKQAQEKLAQRKAELAQQISELEEEAKDAKGETLMVETHLHPGEVTYEYDPFDEEDEEQELSLLGEGTFGSTHRMRSKADQQVYAVKMIKVKKAGVSVDMLKGEATRLAMLNHLHIVRYFTACTFKDGKVFAIVTELLTGGSFLDRIRKGASQEEVARLVAQVASALAYMHRLRMQHRDVKPDNVLLDNTGHAKLIDVGLACTLGSKSRVSTKAGGIVGSNLYMSPEKGGGKSYDNKDDVWALGCMLVGGVLRKPLEDMGLNAIGFFALNRQGVDDLIADALTASAHLGGLVQAMLSQDPRKRPDAQKVAEGLLPDLKLATEVFVIPNTWTPLPSDPMQVLIVPVPDGPQKAEVMRLFHLTAPLSVHVKGVFYVQNLALWYSFALKRQTMLMGEKSAAGAAARYERRLFHGCPADLVSKIAQQGFNRSFTGATSGRALYGKGVYFARDARYSMSKEYSPPDADGVQNMFLVRAVVGEICIGVKDALTPAARHGDQLYDSTVDDVQNPAIYVTYSDSQVYPDILIKFSQ